MRARRLIRVGLAVLALAVLLAAGRPARADDSPSPRTTVVIGGVSVVLIAANGKLLAFIDRIADNSPASDAELTVTPIGRQPVPLTRVGDAMMVAPFDPGSRSSDNFSIAVRSTDGTGQRAAELVYQRAPATAPAAPRPRLATLLAVAALSSALGAAVALLATLWYRMLRRRRLRPARLAAGRVGAT